MSKQITIEIDDDVYEELELQAEANDYSVEGFVGELVNNSIN